MTAASRSKSATTLLSTFSSKANSPAWWAKRLPHGNCFLSILGKFGPVFTNRRVVIEPAARMGQRQSHRREAFGCGVNDNHRVLFPRIPCFLIPHTTPQVNHLFTLVINTTSRTQFVSFGEILGERLAHRLITGAHKAMDFDPIWRFNADFISALLNQ